MTVLKYIENNWSGTIRNIQSDQPNPNDPTKVLIGLPKPYSVSGFDNVFQEMYYWGTYFTNVGLIISERVEQARNNVDDMVYLIHKLGFVPNANRKWGATRSQPPFLSQMVRDVYEVSRDKRWLQKCYTALKKEHEFWQIRRMTETGLNRYFGEDTDLEYCVKHYCKRLHLDYPQDPTMFEEYAYAFQAGAESGWDFSSRVGIFSHHFNWLDLNCMLYNIEINMGYFAKELSNGESEIWHTQANERKSIMNDLLWNEDVGAFCDYDFVNKKQSSMISLAMIFPLYVGIATCEQAQKTVKILKKLEFEYGLSSCEPREDLLSLQWDYPHAWPCLQMIAIKALIKYGYYEDAKRIAQKYIDVADKNFATTNQLWEKYNAVTGEVSKTKEYTTPPMMGWSAATYLYCYTILD